ncbi:hypothetical protein GEMRC1_002351 [Eukaryota sp. GEM-RC1]
MKLFLSSTDTITSLFSDSSLSDQTLIFGEEVLQVNKNILASNSQFFRSLWYLEFEDKYENPLNFSHLKIMYGFQVDVTQNNSYDLFYLAHYFMVEKLVNKVEQILFENFHDMTWIEEFLSRADENQDLRAIEFVGPFLDKVKDINVANEINLSACSIKLLTKVCTTNQSLSWMIRSVVCSIKNSNFELSHLSNILNLANVNLLSFKEWEEFILSPLSDIPELEQTLKDFTFDQLKVIYFDSLLNENKELKNNWINHHSKF